MKNILVLSASVGAGHMRAAQAVELALRQSYPDANVKNVDILELTNAAFRSVYGKAYIDLVNKAPHILGYMYDMLDKPRSPKGRTDKLRLIVERLNLKKFTALLIDQKWDLAINTHFLPAEIIASLRKRKKLHLPQVTVTTDFDTHRLWVNKPCERYFTATEEGRHNLAAWEIPLANIEVAGIPIHPAFAEPKDSGECRHKHDLSTNRPVILQLAGGFGVGPIARIANSILAVVTPLHLVVVTGRNAKAKKQLEALEVPVHQKLTVLGFTDQMDELMAAADIVVSKPGGLTTSETLARGAAMIIVDPIPGQEGRNSDYLLENGAAIKVNNIHSLPHKLEALLIDRRRLDQIRAAAKHLSHPRAAFEVVERSLDVIGGYK